MKKLLTLMLALVVIASTLNPIAAKADDVGVDYFSALKEVDEEVLGKALKELGDDYSAITVKQLVDDKGAGVDASLMPEIVKKYDELLKDKKKDAYTKVDIDEQLGTIRDTIAIEADLEGGAAWLTPELISIVSTIVGFLTTAAMLLIGLFTAVDVLYLVVPPLNAYLTEKSEASGKTNKDGSVKVSFVSRDAVKAYTECQDNNKNVIIAYGKRRLVEYIAVAVVIYLLLSGNLSVIIELALKIVAGGVDSIGKVANSAG